MYRVSVKNHEGEFPLYEPLDETLRIFEPVLTQEMGRGGSFSFSIHTSHPNFRKIVVLRSEIIVRDDQEIVFWGRVFKPECDFKNITTIVCEGDLSYLLDSQQRPYEHTGSIQAFIERLLDNHNRQVDDYKKIYAGSIIVSDSNGYILRSSTDFGTTQDILINKLVNVYGGYLRIRNENGRKYLDYLWDYGGINNQIIRFGENLLDLNKYLDGGSIITCLIPQGANVEYQDANGEVQTRSVDITSVNSGKDYIQNDDAIAVYGKVWGSQKWEDVTVPGNLLTKAKAYLKEVGTLPTTMEINAVDLSLIDHNVQKFQLGFWTNVLSAPHEIEHRFLLTKREINLLDPTAGSIVLGRTVTTLTGNTTQKQAELAENINKVAENASQEINRKVENATNLITGGLGGYVVIDNIDPNTGRVMHPWRILIMNTPDKDTARNVIQLNQNGIGFSTSGINGPYRNAWTIDGNLVADFITSGSMLATRIRGGSLEMGGGAVGRDGSIIMYDANGAEIGRWDKNGLNVKKGDITGLKLRLGGINGADGSIIMYDANGAEIGRWDKDGFTTKKGAINGGSINIGNGTFVVDDRGRVVINSGNVELGPLTANDAELILGDFTISSDNTGTLVSRNGWVQIDCNERPSGSPGGGYASLKLGGQGYVGATIDGIGNAYFGEVSTRSIVCYDDMTFPHNSWMNGWTLIDTLKDIYRKINNLQ